MDIIIFTSNTQKMERKNIVVVLFFNTDFSILNTKMSATLCLADKSLIKL